MSLVNFTTREITCKIVYYGPGTVRQNHEPSLHLRARSGDPPRAHGLARDPDRSDALLRLPAASISVRSLASRPASSSTPCPARSTTTRPAGSCSRAPTASSSWATARPASSMRTSRASRTSTQTFASSASTSAHCPLVLQYNKQDLPSELILTPAELDDALNFRDVPSFGADALHGQSASSRP